MLEAERAVVYAYQMKAAGLDLQAIQQLLREFDPGPETQGLQRDVLDRLTTLRKALDRELKRREDEDKQQQQQQQQQQNGKPRLVPPLAELKMLRGMQMDVNDRTRGLYDALQASGTKDLNRVQKRILQRVTSSQGNIRELLSELNEALMEQAQQAQGGEGGGGDGGGDGGGGEGDGGGGEGDGEGQGAGEDGQDGQEGGR